MLSRGAKKRRADDALRRVRVVDAVEANEQPALMRARGLDLQRTVARRSRPAASDAPAEKSDSTRRSRVALDFAANAEEAGDAGRSATSLGRAVAFILNCAASSLSRISTAHAAFGGRAHERAQRLRHASAAADDLAEIFADPRPVR